MLGRARIVVPAMAASMALTTGFCAKPPVESRTEQVPVYARYYSPGQIHATWTDLNKNGAMDPYENPRLPVDKRVEDLLSRMTVDEKVMQIAMPEKLEGQSCRSCGDGGVSPAVDRLGIPEFSWYADESLHGVQSISPATVFPFSIGLGATWDEALVHDLYAAVGDEFRAAFNVGSLRGSGLVTWSPVVLEISRNKKYDRAPETFGEDPYLTARLAAATVRGFQGEDEGGPYEKAVCTAKHYVYCQAGGDEFPLGAPITERLTRETIFPPYKSAIRKGRVRQVMTGAHGWDDARGLGGDAINYSRVMIRRTLRDQWGFQGIVCSDCGGLGEAGRGENLAGAAAALATGIDSNACGTTYSNNLPQAVEKGLVDLAEIDGAVGNFLAIRFRLGLFDPPAMNPYNAYVPEEKVLTKEHIALALQAARESIVLLKNDGRTLPLDRDKVRSIAVIGPCADSDRSLVPLDYNGTPPYWVTPLEGIRKAVGPGTEVRTSLSLDPEEAAAAARGADVAVVVTGPDPAFESTARTDLALPEGFLPLLQAVQGTGTPTVAVLVNGTPISNRWMKENVPAIVEAWYGGMEGGTAIAEVLFGDTNPGGKLPWTYPQAEAGPSHYDVKPGDPPYDENVYLWPFGCGLSYTTFEYRNLQISPQSSDAAFITVGADVRNAGDRKGDAVVQLYLKDLEATVPVPLRQLKGFERVTLEPGESRHVEFALTPDDLSLLDANLEYVVEPGAFEVMIGESCQDIVLRDTFEITRPIRAVFECKDLTVSKTRVKALERVTVTALVVGTGGMEEGEVRLFVDGKSLQARKVCLAAGERRIVTLTCEIGGAGTHKVTVGDLPGVDVIVEKP